MPNSDFYKMVNEVYTISQNLTPDDLNIVKTWSDSPVNYNLAAHNYNILTQLILKYRLPLDETAVLFAKYGIVANDAGVIIFKAKYQYNQVRPITYIRSVLGQSTWNTVIPTHPHPEYLWGHAVASQAFAEVLKDKFGYRTPFKDKTHDALYGIRSYTSFDAYGQEAAWSGVLSGLHYKNTANISLKVGVQVGRLANRIRFKKEGHHAHFLNVEETQ